MQTEMRLLPQSRHMEAWRRHGNGIGRDFAKSSEIQALLRPFGRRSHLFRRRASHAARLLIDFLKKCKRAGIHTALDTAGFGIGRYEEILKYTDLVILDIKHVDRAGYRQLAGGDIGEFYKFAHAVNESGKKVWIRHVVVPGMTDGNEHMKKLGGMIRKFDRVEKIELLPYHNLGVSKYQSMGIAYRLQGLLPMNAEKVEYYQKQLRETAGI